MIVQRQTPTAFNYMSKTGLLACIKAQECKRWSAPDQNNMFLQNNRHKKYSEFNVNFFYSMIGFLKYIWFIYICIYICKESWLFIYLFDRFYNALVFDLYLLCTANSIYKQERKGIRFVLTCLKFVMTINEDFLYQGFT